MSIILDPSSILLRLQLLIFLKVMGAFLACKSTPHTLGSLVQADIVVGAGKIAHALALLAHGGIGCVLAAFLPLNRLSADYFLFGHANYLLARKESPGEFRYLPEW